MPVVQFRKHSRQKNDEERILPLINIVFLLLIFFMVAGQLSATDPLNVEPPRSVSDGPPGAGETVVSVGVDGRLALDGEVVDEAALRAGIAERQGPVHLKGDGQADSARVVAVMTMLREAGVSKVTLLTVPTMP